MTRRRPRRRAGVLLVVALAWGAVCFVPGRPAGAAPARIDQALVIGDSVSAAISLYPSGVPALQAKHTSRLDLKVCRRLITASCPYQGVTPPNALDTLRAAAGTFKGVLVVAAGYNDTTANVGLAIDRLVAEAQRQGIGRVVWLTYEQRGTNAGLYAAHNATLRAKLQQYPSILRVADWNAKSAGHADWFSSGDPTSVHLSRAGAEALTAYLGVALDAYAGRDRCASANWRGAAVPTAAPPAPASGRLHVLATPVRVYDTRSLDGTLGAARVLTLPLRAVGAVPADAVAAVVTVTLVAPCAGGYAAVGPCASSLPRTTLTSAFAGQIVANSATVELSAGSMCVYVGQASDVIVDLQGWYGAGGTGSRLVAPARLSDTRAGRSQVLPTPQHRLAAGGILTVPLGTVAPGAQAVTVNLTAVGPSGAGFAKAYPGPCASATPPSTSSVNFAKGVTTAAGVLVGVGSGEICVRTSAPSDYIVDLVAVHDPAGHAVTAVTPVRVGDTRNTGTKAPVAAGATLAVGLDGKVSVPSGATAAIVNLTAISSAAGGWVTATTCGQTVPKVSSLNTVAGAAISNVAIVPVSSGHRLCLYSKASTHLVVDLEGWLA